jgi:hypothetical protein
VAQVIRAKQSAGMLSRRGSEGAPMVPELNSSLRMRRLVRPLLLISCVLAVSLLASCDDDEIENVATAKLDGPSRTLAPPTPASVGIAARPSSPAGVIGLTQQQVELLLGPPMEQTDMAPAQAWRYRGDRCTLELYFYIDVKSRIFRTLSYDMIPREADAGARRRCLAELKSHAQGKIVDVSNPVEPQRH